MSKTNKSNDFSCETMLHDDAPRTHLLKVYITDSEAAYIKRAAGGLSASTYARNILLKAGNGRCQFTIEDGDVSAVAEALHECNNGFWGFVGGLQHRSELYQSDIDHICNLLKGTNDIVKNCLREIRNDRKHIRKKGEEYLKLKMDEYIKPEDFQIGETKTGRKGQRRNRPKVPTTVIVGSLSGNTRKAMAIIKDAISWGDKIEVASDDPMIQNWIGSMKSTGTFKPFSEYQKESNVQDQVSKGHIVSASKQVNDTAHVKIDKSHIPSAFSVSQIEDSWDDDDWFL